MAKTSKLKNAHKPAANSRAARRSAPADVTSDTKNFNTSSSSTFLAPHVSGGISKRKAHPKLLSRKQRLRHEAVKQKADQIRDKLHVKVSDSLGRSERRNRRRRTWEEVDVGIEKEIVSDKRGPKKSASESKAKGIMEEDVPGRTDIRVGRDSSGSCNARRED